MPEGGPGADVPWLTAPAAAQMWKEQVASVTISRLHKDVSDALYALGIDHENEGLTEDALFSVDILARPQRVAIEVDGPFHFSANTLRSMGAPLDSRAIRMTALVLPRQAFGAATPVCTRLLDDVCIMLLSRPFTVA